MTTTLNEVIDTANDLGEALRRGREIAGMEPLDELEPIAHIEPIGAEVRMLEFCNACDGIVDAIGDCDCLCRSCGMRSSRCELSLCHWT